jgi:hypothetical protein
VPKKVPADVGSLARAYTKSAISTLGTLSVNAENEGVRQSAAVALLSFGWGKPKQTNVITGADGEGPPEFIVRHIMEGSKPPKK